VSPYNAGVVGRLQYVDVTSNAEMPLKYNITNLPSPTIMYTRQDSSFGIATGYEVDDRGVGVRVPVGSRIFSSSDRFWGTRNLL
jgi:hypothetical protein